MSEDNPFKTVLGGFRAPEFKGFTSTSHYVETRDGVKIAVDILLPKPVEPGRKFTTILIQTRYWRAIALKPPVGWFLSLPTNPAVARNMVKYGYAIATVDVRGTGASTGNRLRPLDKPEVLDGADIMNWVIGQPWSDGNVVSWGNSYSGMTAEASLSLKHQAMRGAILRHNPYDLYSDAFLPGGVFNKGFIHYWSSIGKSLDTTAGTALAAFKPFNPLFGTLAPLLVSGVNPVTNRKDLNLPAKIHLDNSYPENYGDIVEFRDDTVNEEQFIIDQLSNFSYKKDIEDAGAPMFCFGSWLDSNTANIVLHRFLSYSNPQVAVITDWNHTAHRRASPFHPPAAKAPLDAKQQVQEWVSFFDTCVAGKASTEKVLYYYTMGEEKWKKTTTWPPANQTMQKWYIQACNSLSMEKPIQESGHDTYTVDHEMTTGIRNRWYTLLTLPVDYRKFNARADGLLVYTSPPVEADVEITGHPVVDFNMSTSHDDGIICVYLQLVRGNEVSFITDGQLRFKHRKITDAEPHYRMPYPHQSFLKRDALPVEPGKVMNVRFALYPTSVLLKKGNRIRVSISGADKDSFRRYPAEGTPVLTFHRTGTLPSCIELPVIERP